MKISEKILLDARENYIKFVVQRFGYKVGKNFNLQDAIGYYKKVSPFLKNIKYKVYQSNEFSESLGKMNKGDVIQGYRCIKQKLERGEDISSFCSRNHANQGYVDALLRGWGIYHFHFKDKERTSELLFATLKENKIYFIDIKNHESFSDIGLLTIIDENWPDLLCRQNGLEGQSLSSDEIKGLTKNGINTLYKLPNGSSVMPFPEQIHTIYQNIYDARIIKNRIYADTIFDHNFIPHYLNYYGEDIWFILSFSIANMQYAIDMHGDASLIFQELTNSGLLVYLGSLGFSKTVRKYE
jgi:hypothetical protein